METTAPASRLYLVKRKGRTGYDEPRGYVIAARSPARAFRIAVTAAAKHDFGRYDDETETGPIATSFREGGVKFIGTAASGTAEGIILQDFVHG